MSPPGGTSEAEGAKKQKPNFKKERNKQHPTLNSQTKTSNHKHNPQPQKPASNNSPLGGRSDSGEGQKKSKNKKI